MDWQDQGFVLAARRHGESDAILTLLTREHGRHLGIVKGGSGRRHRAVVEIGNRITADWHARLSEHLGRFQVELAAPHAAMVLSDPARLAALSSACATLDAALPEREPHAEVFDDFGELASALSDGKAEWPADFVRWEARVLTTLGFGLDLTHCAVTGETEGLAYVSPKTGRAVTTEAGRLHKDKLLPLPTFLLSSQIRPSRDELVAGLRLTGYFLDRHVFAHAPKHGASDARTRLVERMVARKQGAESLSKRVVVIGAGIVGCSAALWLQRDGHQVTIIDKSGPGEGASKGNASVIATESCLPVAYPGILWDVPKYLSDPLSPLAIRWSYLPKLAPWLWKFVRSSGAANVEQISIALRTLLVEALAAHKELAAAAGCRDIIQETGWLGIFESEAKWQSSQSDFELQRRRGIKIEILKGEEIRQFEPSLQPIYKHAAYFPENSYVLDNFRLVRALAEDVTRNGGKVVKDEIVDFEIGANGPTAAIGKSGRYDCDAVVLTAGAWSRKLAARLGEHVPLETERGYHVTLPNADKRPRMPLYSGDYSFAITPLDIGLRFAGTVELGGLNLPPNPARNDVLIKHGRRMFGALNETGRSDWMGFRPSMPDSKPVIDRGRRFKNTFYAFGHGHIGLTLGPITGKLIADLVNDRKSGIDLAPFAVDRF